MKLVKLTVLAPSATRFTGRLAIVPPPAAAAPHISGIGREDLSDRAVPVEVKHKNGRVASYPRGPLKAIYGRTGRRVDAGRRG